MPLLRDLIEIPESLPANQFVLRLSEGVRDPAATLKDYVVTEQLAEAFAKALRLIRDGLLSRSSNGAYLHGSFGSGKSHYMAVLHLILSGEPAAGVDASACCQSSPASTCLFGIFLFRH
jgi:chromosomal replication initiation ATPase DnaA